MKVELKEGQAVVLPKKGKSFDPTQIPKAVEDAGFAAREIEVTASGILVMAEDGFRLNMEGPLAAVLLAGGEKETDLTSGSRLAELLGRRVRVTGKFTASKQGLPSVLTVERWDPIKPADPVARDH